MTLMVLALASLAVGYLLGYLLGDWFSRATYRAMYQAFIHSNQGIANITAPTMAELNAGRMEQG